MFCDVFSCALQFFFVNCSFTNHSVRFLGRRKAWGIIDTDGYLHRAHAKMKAIMHVHTRDCCMAQQLAAN